MENVNAIFKTISTWRHCLRALKYILCTIFPFWHFACSQQLTRETDMEHGEWRVTCSKIKIEMSTVQLYHKRRPSILLTFFSPDSSCIHGGNCVCVWAVPAVLLGFKLWMVALESSTYVLLRNCGWGRRFCDSICFPPVQKQRLCSGNGNQPLANFYVCVFFSFSASSYHVFKK